MYEHLIPVLLSLLYTITDCANYERYGETTYRYPSSTIANLNNNFPYKSVSYGNDLANFPEATRYPNYSPGYSSSTRYPYSAYSTSSYNNLYNSGSSTYNGASGSYNTGSGLYNSGSSNVNLNGASGSYNTGSGLYNSGSSNVNLNGASGSYNTGSGLYNSGSSNVNNNQGYNYNRRYGGSYGGRGVGSGLQGGYSSYEAPFMGNMGSCVNRSPQTGIWVDSLMGMWYGVELIQHLGADSTVDYPRTCIVIHIAEPREQPSTEYQVYHVQHINAKFRQDNRHLRLLWNEAGQTSEYALYFRNDTAGYWHVYDGQNGTLTHLPNYQQFGGTVQVLKAINNQLLLNFCQEAGLNGRPAQLYSVLFSREPGQLSQWEIDSVHSVLQTKRLSIASRRMVCGNSAANRPLTSVVFSLLTCLLAYVIGKS